MDITNLVDDYDSVIHAKCRIQDLIIRYKLSTDATLILESVLAYYENRLEALSLTLHIYLTTN